MIKLYFRKKHLIILFTCYIVCSLYLLYVSSFCGRAVMHRVIQPIPFRTIIDQFSFKYGFDLFLGNMLGNILLLFPCGLFMAILGIKTKLRSLVLFVLIAFSIEFMQFILAVGCMDIDDIWVNALGGYWGYKTGINILNGN